MSTIFRLDLRNEATRQQQELLAESEFDRPSLHVVVDQVRPAVVLHIGPLFAEPRRFVEMRPEEARELARGLIEAARVCEIVLKECAELE